MQFDLKLFNWHPESARLTADASTLGIECGYTPQHIWIKNEQTGNTESFSYSSTIFDDEDDINFWKYVNDSYKCRVKEVIIWND